jgi:acetyl-CoA synthetase
MAPIPGVTATKPGSCTKPLPGIFADIVDEEGRPVKTPDAGGYLVIKRPWPSMLRTIWGDNERYIKTYWEKFKNHYYVAGDSARRDKDGYYWIMGRIDDVLNIAGHRLGTMEIESALAAHPQVAEAAVVSKPHDIKGESAFAYVVLNVARPQGAAAKVLIDELRGWVGEQLSPIAKPDEIRLTDNLPKTRSGKIMRRLLRAVARGEEITQDMSTLENPAIIDQLRGVDSDSGAKAAAAPKKAVKQAAKKAAKKAVKKTVKKTSAKAVKKATKRPAIKAKRAAKPAKRKDTKRKTATRKARIASKRAKPSRLKTRSARRKK